MKNHAFYMIVVLFIIAFVTTFNYVGCGRAADIAVAVALQTRLIPPLMDRAGSCMTTRPVEITMIRAIQSP